MSRDRFFIGWRDAPDLDRRVLIAGAGALALAGAGVAFGLARAQRTPQVGTWDQGDVRAWQGALVRDPYPMLRMQDGDGGWRTALLASSGKTSVAGRIPAGLHGGVTVRASPIRRGDALMLAAIDGADWIAPSPPHVGPHWTEEDLGDVLLVGEILDAKCWFGAMRPGFGKTHKACAALCARGGLPLAFCASGCASEGREPLFLDAHGQPHGRAIIPYLADAVRVEGRMVQVGDMLQLRADLAQIRRL